MIYSSMRDGMTDDDNDDVHAYPPYRIPQVLASRQMERGVQSARNLCKEADAVGAEVIVDR